LIFPPNYVALKYLITKADSRFDDKVAGYEVPTIAELATRVNITMHDCPDFSLVTTTLVLLLCEAAASMYVPSATTTNFFLRFPLLFCCRSPQQHFTLAERPPSESSAMQAGVNNSRIACYVNPFVLHG
jgi:hypothetical protein